MTVSNRGRSTTGQAQVPHYPTTLARDAAKHLRLMVTRYLSDRANLKDVEDAMMMFRHEARPLNKFEWLGGDAHRRYHHGKCSDAGCRYCVPEPR